MSNIIKIKKGLDIPLSGAVPETLVKDTATQLFGITPDDYPGYTWKCAVKAGETVKIGDALLKAKEDERINIVSPVAGVVNEIRRGERRKIEVVSVTRQGEQVPSSDLNHKANQPLTIDELMKSGLFVLIRQRPFDIVPFADATPRDIFITAFDSAPLAAEMMTSEMKEYLEEGIKALKKLTSGNVYLSVRKGSGLTSGIAEVYEFEGPHPAGNVGTQIAAISPVNKGESVWTLDAITAARIGKYQKEGVLDFSTRVAMTGDDVKTPEIIETTVGASLETLLKGKILSEGKNVRVISGNVLTGYKVNPTDGFLRYPYRQITAIDEGDDADEFMGWASVDPRKYSVKHSFPAFLRGLSKPFKFDARIKGGHRAMIMSGEYDKVFPMDIYPEYLLKAIMAKDIEKMEQLGIYEVAPEDFALAEFVDTSKIELQKLVREGLDYLRKETL